MSESIPPPSNAPPVTLEEMRTVNEQLVLATMRMQRLEDERRECHGELLARVEDAVFETDARLTITTWNPAAASLYGWSSHDVLGRTLHDVVTPSAPSHAPNVPLEQARNWEQTHHTKDGKAIEVAGTTVPLHDESGNVKGTLTVCRDVSVRRALERSLLAQAAETRQIEVGLQEVGRLKSAFLTMMTHELRTPLNPIIGFTSLMMEGGVGALTPEQTDVLKVVHASATHLLGMIDEILLVAQLEAAQVPLQTECVDLDEMISESLVPLKEAIAGKDLEITRTATARICVDTDRHHLRGVLSRLLGNAVKYTPRGSIRIDLSAEPGHATIRISDTGIGLTQQDLASLFTAFQQTSSSTGRRFEGIGLSLFTCKKLMQHLGGSLCAESESGEGTTFTLTLPRKHLTETGTAPAASRPGSS